jgi:DNA repair exonuclease SbcCD ATPase subunit
MIKFKSIKWKNFLSTGNQYTEVLLDKSTTTLVIGENGAGKSTILDAICFVLFNKPFRNVNKPQLMNTINSKNLEVQVVFSIGKKEYKVIRGIKPGIFEIYSNDQLLNQDAASKDYQKYLEDSILKLNYKSFTQIVILGSASFTPFMQLPLGHRREIIEDILDIQIFSIMNGVLKNKILENKTNISDIDNRLEMEKLRIKMQQEYIKTLENDKNKKITEVNALIETATTEINTIEQGLAVISESIKNLEDTISDETEYSNKKTKLIDINKKLIQKINSARQEIDFYSNHDNCPTCSQTLSEDLKTSHMESHNKKIVDIEAALTEMETQSSAIENRLNEIDKIKKKIAELNTESIKQNNQIIAGQNYIRKLQKEIIDTSSNVGNISEEKIKLKSMAKEAVALTEKKGEYTKEKHYLDIANVLLKDTGIKTKIIKQYLPVINKLVNKYLSAMDFFCHFELDESFNEVIKSRHRDEFSYASFSEGEKQRIDLALLFTWRTIAKMKNSSSTNLLLLDEVFDSSLDSNGTDYVMNLLNTLGDETNVFVISHKGDLLFDKFRSVVKFEKHQNFSRITK